MREERAERLIKDYRTRKRLSEVNNTIGRGQNGDKYVTETGQKIMCSYYFSSKKEYELW